MIWAVWACGTFCESSDIEEYMRVVGLSDDFYLVDVDDDVEVDTPEFYELITL
jgi:hypothetical protein